MRAVVGVAVDVAREQQRQRQHEHVERDREHERGPHRDAGRATPRAGSGGTPTAAVATASSPTNIRPESLEVLQDRAGRRSTGSGPLGSSPSGRTRVVRRARRGRDDRDQQASRRSTPRRRVARWVRAAGAARMTAASVRESTAQAARVASARGGAPQPYLPSRDLHNLGRRTRVAEAVAAGSVPSCIDGVPRAHRRRVRPARAAGRCSRGSRSACPTARTRRSSGRTGSARRPCCG